MHFLSFYKSNNGMNFVLILFFVLISFFVPTSFSIPIPIPISIPIPIEISIFGNEWPFYENPFAGTDMRHIHTNHRHARPRMRSRIEEEKQAHLSVYCVYRIFQIYFLYHWIFSTGDEWASVVFVRFRIVYIVYDACRLRRRPYQTSLYHKLSARLLFRFKYVVFCFVKKENAFSCFKKWCRFDWFNW